MEAKLAILRTTLSEQDAQIGFLEKDNKRMIQQLSISPPNESWDFMSKHMETNQQIHQVIEDLKEKYGKVEALLVAHGIIGSGFSRSLEMYIDSKAHKSHRVESGSGSRGSHSFYFIIYV